MRAFLRPNIQLFASNSNIVTRNDAEALIPVETTQGVIKAVTQKSAVLSLMRKLPNMTAKQQRMPVLSALAVAGFVNGDTGLKSVSKAAWKNKFITAEEIAVIIPIPEAVLDDASYDIWGELKPQIEEEFGRVIDAAALFDVDRPASWPQAIVSGALAAGRTVALGTGIDIAEDVNQLMAAVEACGYDVNGFIGDVAVKSKFRGLRDNNGGLIFQPSLQAGTPETLYGHSMSALKDGAWDTTKGLMIGGDFSQAVYSIRQDITYKVLDQAVISDGDGNIIYNLAQQDMVALRCVMRLGWQLPNPISRMEQDESKRYPFAVLTGSVSGASTPLVIPCATLPESGMTGKIYVLTAAVEGVGAVGDMYTWNGTEYVAYGQS